MKTKHVLPFSLLLLLAIFIPLTAYAVDVYIFVHDKNANTQIRDRSGRIMSVPIRVIGTEPAFVQPGYRGPQAWCKLQGTQFRTECTSDAIMDQIDRAEFESSRKEHNKLCAKYALTSFGVPAECQSPDYKSMSDFIGQFPQPKME